MAQFSLNEHINAPRDKVFAHASNFAGAPQFIKGIKKVEMLTNGPVGVGTRFKETRIMFNREATEVMEVVAFDPPKSYTLGGDSCGCRFSSTFTFTPNGTGTDVVMTFAFQPLTFMAKVIGFLTRPMLKMCVKAMAKDLTDMKTAIESGSLPVPPIAGAVES
jgi:hypothetical protein